MGRGRRRTRTGNEIQSTFEKTPALEIAILELQKRYLETGRGKPSMRDLLVEGLELLLEKERLPTLQEPKQAAATVIAMPTKAGT